MARGTIANILKKHGIEPAPDRRRKTTWKEFIRQHWELIAAADFFTVEVWIPKGLHRYIVLFFLNCARGAFRSAASQGMRTGCG